MKKQLYLFCGLFAAAHIPHLKKRRGEVPKFTLIELLVAVAIIGILTSLAVPSFTAARLRSLDGSCRNNLRQLGMANQLYAFENADYFVPYSLNPPRVSGPIWLGYQEVPAGSVYGRVDLTCDALLGDYYGGSPLVAVCPEMRKFIPDSRRAASGGGYGYNGIWLGGFPVRGFARFYKSTAIYAPAATVMFGDAALSQMGTIPLDPPLRLPLLNGKFEADAFGGGGDGFGTVHARHRAAANIGWTDGHVNSVRLGSINADASSQRNLIGHAGDRTTDFYRILKPIAPSAAPGLR
ncbi:MAG: type II secretion system protein [Victivallaceae bacterium]